MKLIYLISILISSNIYATEASIDNVMIAIKKIIKERPIVLEINNTEKQLIFTRKDTLKEDIYSHTVYEYPMYYTPIYNVSEDIFDGPGNYLRNIIIDAIFNQTEDNTYEIFIPLRQKYTKAYKVLNCQIRYSIRYKKLVKDHGYPAFESCAIFDKHQRYTANTNQENYSSLIPFMSDQTEIGKVHFIHSEIIGTRLIRQEGLLNLKSEDAIALEKYENLFN